MAKQQQATNAGRRRFLRDSLTAAGAASVALTAGNAAAAIDQQPAAAESERQDKGYQLTQHVVDYYKTAAL